MDRVNELLYKLYGKNIAFADACRELGFSEDDLSDSELNEINKELFRCSDCGKWVRYREFNITGNDCPVCDHCYDMWFEEEY